MITLLLPSLNYFSSPQLFGRKGTDLGNIWIAGTLGSKKLSRAAILKYNLGKFAELWGERCGSGSWFLYYFFFLYYTPQFITRLVSTHSFIPHSSLLSAFMLIREKSGARTRFAHTINPSSWCCAYRTKTDFFFIH